MRESDRTDLIAALAGEGAVLFDEPMSRHTTLRIGGVADAWVEPTSAEAVSRVRALCHARAWPCRAVGAGSNLLVRDGGVRGVLLSSRQLRRLEFSDTRVIVEAGVATGKLLAQAMQRGLGGLEFLGGVPGSVGGGLMMNAGTYLGEFKDVTERVTTVDGCGALRTIERADCGFVYRGSAIPTEDMLICAALLLHPREPAAIAADVAALRQRRRQREPHGVANAGSIFKNPPGDFAGRLIEAAGLKGARIGGAQVSPVHANWLVNAGDARAADMLALIALVRDTVHKRAGVVLDLEVRVIGEGLTA